MKALVVVLIASILLLGCVKAPGGQSVSPTPIDDLIHEDLNATATASAPDTTADEIQQTGDIPTGDLPADGTENQSTKNATAAPTFAPSTTPTNEPTITPGASPTPEPTTSVTVQQIQVFAVEMDDGGFYPDQITVLAGQPVNLTLHLRSTNVYYGGADVKSQAFTELGFKPGEARSVLFTADGPFEVTETWPTSGVVKGILSIKVSYSKP